MAEAAPHSGEIRVSSKTLGLISAGIYRSPAGAIKELISNAFDADAEWVRIGFNPPSFDVVSVADNGTGITFQKFIDLMQRQIGESDKRAEGDLTPINKRPLIGRIGIGILAIGQICHTFDVVSHHPKSRTAFRAHVELVDYIHEELEREISEAGPRTRHDIGRYQIVPIPYNKDQNGTRLIATELKKGFVQRMRNAPPSLPREFRAFYQRVVRLNTLRELSEYWRTTWSIALSAPLPYLDPGPVRRFKVEGSRNRELESFGFRVAVEGMSLRRPVVLPPREDEGVPEDDVHVATLELDEIVDGSPIRGSGYIYVQSGRSLYPAEIRGLLIRVKGVAIGSYDKSFLDHPLVEGPRFGWMSGEFDFAEGLEDSLNIDRDSFNETHPHYLKVQQYVHHVITEEVRGWLFRNLTKRKRQRDAISQEARKETIARATATYLPNPTIEHVRETYRAPQAARFVSPVKLDKKKGRIFINDAAPWPRARAKRELAELVAIGFELALDGSTPEEMRRRFYDLLQEIL